MRHLKMVSPSASSSKSIILTLDIQLEFERRMLTVAMLQSMSGLLSKARYISG